MWTSACFRGKLKNSRRHHSSKNTGKGCLKGAVDMEAPGNGLLVRLHEALFNVGNCPFTT